jgi:putative toxin-antitoxin system antitoxin component (TIGR02293 family)
MKSEELRENHNSEPDVSETRATEILKAIQSYALEVLGDENRANAWLNAPMPSLSYQTPISLLKTESGERRVRNLLNCIDYGVYS